MEIRVVVRPVPSEAHAVFVMEGEVIAAQYDRDDAVLNRFAARGRLNADAAAKIRDASNTQMIDFPSLLSLGEEALIGRLMSGRFRD